MKNLGNPDKNSARIDQCSILYKFHNLPWWNTCTPSPFRFISRFMGNMLFLRPSLVLISIMKLNIDQLKSVSCWIILIIFLFCVCMMINNLTRRQTHEWQWWYTRIWVLGWTQGYASKWKKMFCLYECFPNVCFLWVFCLSQKSFFFVHLEYLPISLKKNYIQQFCQMMVFFTATW